MSWAKGKCVGPYEQPCITYADDKENLRLYQWCAVCLYKLSERLNQQGREEKAQR